MRYKRGESYLFRYKNFHIDPAPYLYVTHSDRKHTEGFNLHYLPNIRFRVPIETYKRQDEDYWGKAYDGLKQAGFFKGFLKMLDEAHQNDLSKSQFRRLTELVDRKYPWAMKSYRRYYTNQLKLRR